MSSKPYFDRSSNTRCAFQFHFGVVVLNGVLDDAQAQAGAARLFGMALIHPIEPFKDTALVLQRDANAGIEHRQNAGFHRDPHL